MNSKNITHVVRRYGLAGGMERYVWELTHGLARRDFQIHIVCEDVVNMPLLPNILIHRVMPSDSKRRWQQMLRFRKNVETELGRQEFDSGIIHSHERCLSHHVTTFHGPSIFDRRFSLISRLASTRIRAWESMERREVSHASVQAIVAVSDLVASTLKKFHPEMSEKNIFRACPGICFDVSSASMSTQHAHGEFRYVFVGKEWKRKGLDFAVRVVDRLAQTTGWNVCLDVYGPEPATVPYCIQTNPRVRLHGWRGVIPYSKYKAMIHPARKEPFGMIISEARALGLPVLASDQTGAQCLDFSGASFLSLRLKAEIWSDALQKITINEQNRDPEVLWTWDDLVTLHVNDIYPKIELQ